MRDDPNSNVIGLGIDLFGFQFNKPAPTEREITQAEQRKSLLLSTQRAGAVKAWQDKHGIPCWVNR